MATHSSILVPDKLPSMESQRIEHNHNLATKQQQQQMLFGSFFFFFFFLTSNREVLVSFKHCCIPLPSPLQAMEH